MFLRFLLSFMTLVSAATAAQAHAFAERRWREMKRRYNKFLPPDSVGTLLLGYSGGAEWGGSAVDPEGIFYQNANEAFWDLQMNFHLRELKPLASTPVQSFTVR